MATLMSFLNISFFIAFAGIPLVPSFIVFSIGFYMRLCNSVGFNFSRAVVSVVNFRVSAKRVGDFLLMKELDMRPVDEPNDQELAIKIDNLNFSWKQDEFSLKNINVQVKKGDFVSIVGPVGSGKVKFFIHINFWLERNNFFFEEFIVTWNGWRIGKLHWSNF